MLNIQNNRYVPYQPKMVTRQDGKIMMCWIESTVTSGTGNIRIGAIIYNQDGTAHTAVSYTPWANSINVGIVGETFITADNSLNIYIGLRYGYQNSSPYVNFRLYKFDSSLNYQSAYGLSGSYNNGWGVGIGLWLDTNRTYLSCLSTTGGCYYFNTTTLSFPARTDTFIPDPASNCVGHTSPSDLGAFYKYLGGVYKLNDGTTRSTLLSSGYTGTYGRIFRGHNGIKYFFYPAGGNNIGYKIISRDSSTISAEYILGVAPNVRRLTSGIAFGGNKLFLIISGALYLVTQNLITQELTVELYNYSENFQNFAVFRKDSNLYLAATGYTVRYVDISNLNVGTPINIISSSGFSGQINSSLSSNYDYIQENNKLYLNRGSTADPHKFGLMIESQKFHSLIIANNGTSFANNMNYQLTQLVFGYASVGTHYSTNFVYNFNSFIVQEINKNTPAGTSLTMSYSLDGGSSWTPCTVGLEVTATSSEQIMFETVLTTSDSTTTPAFLDYAVVLKQ